ncbi:MAG: polysaccharide biosynthesis protein [Myxococcales bacterium]|nr:polysaccharide biosynthesis protein [Myxococcales bacterium]MCB9532263.1 polysaccharide biosynthesis protein [Myxococcales bacterium]MCB9533927.1 polysaccharide biosynthesis protein [Myxococcales bacterium]
MESVVSRVARFRRLLIVLAHIVAFATALVLAFLLRLDFSLSEVNRGVLMSTLPLFVLVKTLVFGSFRQYSGWWRFVTLSDLLSSARATLVSAFVLASLVFGLQLHGFPRSVLVLDAILTVGILSTIRVAIRLGRERFVGRSEGDPRLVKRTLVVGTGLTAESLIREAARSFRLNMRVVGIVATEAHMVGSRIGGAPVVGVVSDLASLISALEVGQVVSALDSGNGDAVRDVDSQCRSADVPHRVVPPATALIDGSVAIAKMRDVSLQDLLGRPPVRLDSTQIARIINGETVLVTGAGGSIGSEICRQVARFGPSTLVMLEQAENPLFALERELQAEYPEVRLEPLIADVFDGERMQWAMGHFQPRVVLHAAAHKHVPLMELNPSEAIKNNVIGTLNVVRACQEAQVDVFVLISTDKAVNPTSVMGASKRIAEMVVQGLAPGSQTKLAAVRFGNVLGSNGSVIPIFKQQIAAGGPVTVTHPEMRRYFMTIPEATQLVLQAATYAAPDAGDVFVLDMGEPVAIVDLARDLIRLSGLEPGRDVQIAFTGIRPGEKLFEELATDQESTDTTAHDRIFRSKIAPPDSETVLWAAQRLLDLARQCFPPAQMRRAIFDVLDVLERRGSRDQIDTAANAVVADATDAGGAPQAPGAAVVGH